jgi:transcriptional repressor NrdR
VRCPFCGDEASRVVDTRVGREGAEIRRRRECQECGGRFTTRERVEETLPRIIKRDERREEYDRAKLRLGIERACEKRPVSANMIELLVERIERRLQELGEKEVASRWVGQRALDELTALDPMAAVRFASVFREFHSAEDYTRFFDALAAAKPEPGHS